MKTSKQTTTNLIPGSRIPISFLLDYLKDGYTIYDFISAYPWVKKDKIAKAIEEIKHREFTARYAF